MAEEKKYKFTMSRHGHIDLLGNDLNKTITVKDSELTPEQEDLILGDILKNYNSLSQRLQYKFLLLVGSVKH